MKKITLTLCLLSALVSACGQATATPTARPSTPAAPGPTPAGGSGRAGFAAYAPARVDVQPNVPAYSFKLDAVARPEDLDGLSPAQRAALEKNGFVVIPQQYAQIYQVYENARERGQTVFVSADVVLHAYHIVYDYSLRLLELDHLYGEVQALSVAMLKASQQQAQRAADPKLREAAQLNVAYFAVACALLDPGFGVPSEVAKLVRQETALIEAHAGFSTSPIFDVPEDYSQYVPRGHYTRNETFKRYFRAMMWYGRIGFLSSDEDVERARRHTRQALLVVEALSTARVNDRPALESWERIYEPTVFYVGSADDLTVYDYTQVAAQVYGGLPGLEALGDDAQLDAFRKALEQRPAPRIVGGYVSDQQDAVQATRGFRFMGQRFVPDSAIFQQLVYDKVTGYTGHGQPFTLSITDYGPVRGFPRGLDLAAVLGSARALRILQDEGDTAYVSYDTQLASLRQEFGALSLDDWTQNLYWNWLYSLRPLLDVKGEGYPAFMQSAAWLDKDLHTFLGSWAELRHDTILYAKQSYAVGVTAIQPPPRPASAYVEPQPELYARLAALAAYMQAGLEQRGLLSDELRTRLSGLHSFLLDLKSISEKELRGEALSAEEIDRLRKAGGVLQGLTTFSQKTEDAITSEADTRMAIVADVHTDPNTGQVLEEAVGDAFMIVVLVPVGEDVLAARGGVFSYYEFKQPLAQRLTDEAWQRLARRPAQPAWTGSFVVP